MNILGLSFGTINGKCDILTKEALYSMKEAVPEAEVRFQNTVRLKIGRCIGCGACSRALENGKDNDCIVKDDFQTVEELVRWADALIVAAPVYALQPAGQFKDFIDRFSCRHDISAIPWVLDGRREGKYPGNADDYPIERLRKRYVSYICVGGATTDDWVSMGTPTMHIFGFPAGMKVIANLDVHHTGTMGSPYLDEALMERIHEAGRATAIACRDQNEDAPYIGPQGACPVCHQNLLMVNGTTRVTCPVCGIHGTVSIVGEKLLVDFPKEQQERARGTFRGLREHTTEIQSFGSIAAPKSIANKEFLDEKMKRIKEFDQRITAIQ